MKRALILITCAAVCFLSITSCRNSKTQELTPEEVQQKKQALVNSVLAEMDALEAQFYDATTKSFDLHAIQLTEEEKMVKPDYLLDPSVANTLITKSQKINALAIYMMDYGIRKIYDMPCEEAEEVIKKLAAEVNHPVGLNIANSDSPASEKVLELYRLCKERGNIEYFWQFQYAIVDENNYLLAQNPEFYFSKITEDQWQAYRVRIVSRLKAIETLAKYDEDMAKLWEFRNNHRISITDEERDRATQTIESAKKHYADSKERFTNRRNDLIK